MHLATWNLEHLASDTGTGLKPRTFVGWAHLAEIAREIEADVWLLQEVDSEAVVRQVLREPCWAVRVAPRRWRDRRRSVALRTAIAVNTEKIGPERLKWTDPVKLGGWWVGARLCTEADIGIDGDTVRLLCVHLKSGCWSGNSAGMFGRPSLVCARQMNQQAAVRRWLQAGGLRIAGGDFNRVMADPADAMRKRAEGIGASVIPSPEDRPGKEGRIDHWVLNEAASRKWRKVIAETQTMKYHPENPDHEPVRIEL